MMLSVRLVRMIEDHAEQLTSSLIRDLQSNPRTPSFHHLSREELHGRVHKVYGNLGRWLGRNTDEELEETYLELGARRAIEGIPLHEVVYALILTKYHLRDYIRGAGLVDSAVELYQEQELHRLVGHFFDLAMYYAVKGYECELDQGRVPSASAPAN